MANYKQWQIQVFNKRKTSFIDDSTGVAIVMAGGTTTRSDVVSLVSGQGGAALAQPVVLDHGNLVFYTAKTVTSVDITIMLASGYSIYARGVTSSVHRLDVYPEIRDQLLVFPIKFLASSAAVDTGIDFPAGCLISDAYIWIGVAESADTVDIGFINAVESGDEDGLVDGALATNLGFVNDTAVITAGTTLDYVPVTTRGVLIRTSITGADALATGGGSTPIKYLTDGTIKSLSYTPSSSTVFKGLGFVEYKLLSAAGL